MNRAGFAATIVLSLAALVLSACGSSGTQASLVAIDATGSYRYTPQALEFAAQLIEDARPGDTLYFRWISDQKTPGTDAILATVAIPAISGNPFTGRRQADERQVDAVKKAAAAAIRGASPPPADATNVMGAVAKAPQLLHSSRASARTLILLSDLEENLEIPMQFDLSGIRVVCVMCQSESSLQAIQAFGKAMEAAGATSFTAYEPQMVPGQIIRNLREEARNG